MQRILIFSLFLFFFPAVAFPDSEVKLDCDSYISGSGGLLVMPKEISSLEEFLLSVLKPGFTTRASSQDNGAYQMGWVDVYGTSCVNNCPTNIQMAFVVSSKSSYIEMLRRFKQYTMPYQEIKNEYLDADIFCRENDQNGFLAEIFITGGTKGGAMPFYLSMNLSIL